MVKEQYSAQLEDLASHGFVVVAITHTYDGIVTVFPDGRAVAYDTKRWPTIPSFEGELNLSQLEWHATLPFVGHLDLIRIGAFGHSFGGIAAAHACQMDRRIRACLNQDGAEARKPFRLDARGWGMDQPFMFITRDPERVPIRDENLVAMKYRANSSNDLTGRCLRHLTARSSESALEAISFGWRARGAHACRFPPAHRR